MATAEGRRRKKHGEGSFALRRSNVDDISFQDFGNLWSFRCLFMSDDKTVFNWLRVNGLLPCELICHCGANCTLNRQSSTTDGFTFRCKKGHELGMRKNSFFERSSYNIRDLIVLIKYYIEGHSLHMSAKCANMEYKSTSVHLASYIREVCCEYINTEYEMIRFQGDVELDESLFGRKIKYNREGAWKIAKDHFRRINGTNSNLFEQHLCEIVWRNHVHRAGNIYSSFFDLMKNVYTLDMAPRFTYTKQLFRTWPPPCKAYEARHNITIVQGSDAESDGEETSTVETSEPTGSSLPASYENTE
ncbi:unnamed protein product [Mytilus coruscus]|uniref:ISXO2-like transposase domain-containing protein n=1 Tax=Mytilus coruscus TaxID=42192 RepID=A0A6J8DXJ3_MYTCO|nr:unnamed protein product [Mytilus coruscus]